MTRTEVTEAVHTALRQTHVPLTLMQIRALPFAWELRFEDNDGVERYVTVHQGSVSGTFEAILCALDPTHLCSC
jgi:hypothetical protein